MPSFCQLSSWQSFLWSWLCCCCCLCGLLAGAADSRTFRVSIADVAAAWQSGGASSSSCVSESQFSERPWSLGRVADSDGFHWLLLKLVREVRVLSVTVHAAGGSGLQVLLGSWLPPEAFAADSNCRAVLRHNSTTLSSCGWAGVSAGSTAEFFVQCNRTAIPLPTEHILIRQRPGSSFSSFNGLDITEEANHAYFSTCAAASSKTERCKPGLKHLKLGDSVLVNVSLLCPMDSGRQPSCRITSQAGEQWNGNLRVLKPEAWNFLLELKPMNSLFDWILLCEFSCHNSTRSASTRLQFDVTPKDLQLNFNDSGLQIGGRQFWVEGRSVNFSVTSDGGFPVTLIACRVCNCLEQKIGLGEQQVTYKCQNYSTYEIKRKLVKLETKSTSSCHFCLNVVYEFRLDVSSSLENSCISCGQELSSNESHSAYNTKSETTKQTLKIPPLVYPCEARISLSPGSYWLEGSVVSVTVNSTSSNWPFHTSYHCSVLTQQGEETMRSLSKSVASESFTGHASRRWGSSARIRCSVSQPGLGCERNESINAPPVYYRPAATVQQLSPVLCHGFTAHFRLNVTDLGNPEASFVSCTFAGTFSESRNKVVQGGFAFSFNVTLEDSGKVISCRMKQNLSGADAAEFNSSIINLQKQPESTWTATQTVGVWEGDVISVNVSSVSDSPQVKHQCWLQLKTKLQSEKISLENISESNGQSAFRITAHRSMHGSKLVCIANHPCSSRADQLVQNVSVFYQPQVTFKLHGPNQSHAFVEVSVSEANPKPSKMCSMNLSDSSVSVPKLLPVENGTILKISLQQCQAPSHVRIVCHVNQTAAGKNVLNRTEHSINCSELRGSSTEPTHLFFISVGIGISATTASLLTLGLIVALCIVRSRRKPTGATGRRVSELAVGRRVRPLSTAKSASRPRSDRASNAKRASLSKTAKPTKCGSNDKSTKLAIPSKTGTLATHDNAAKSVAPALPLIMPGTSYADSGDVYLQVVKPEPGASSQFPPAELSESSLTLYTDIVGHIDTDGRTFVSCDCNGQVIRQPLDSMEGVHQEGQI